MRAILGLAEREHEYVIFRGGNDGLWFGYHGNVMIKLNKSRSC